MATSQPQLIVETPKGPFTPFEDTKEIYKKSFFKNYKFLTIFDVQASIDAIPEEY